MLELVRLVHQAIGTDSPRAFVLVFALIGALIFGALGWVVDAAYRKSLNPIQTVQVLPEGNVARMQVADDQEPTKPIGEESPGNTPPLRTESQTGQRPRVSSSGAQEPEQTKKELLEGDGFLFTQKIIESNRPKLPHAVEVVLMAQVTIQPLRLRVVCDEVIGLGELRLPDVISYSGTFSVDPYDPKAFVIDIERYAFRPMHPVTLMLYSDRPFRVEQIHRQ